MMQRTWLRASLCRSGAALACTAALRSPLKGDDARRAAAEKYAKEFTMKPMADHERSSFEYKGSDKGSEVGARNEAAFLNYEPFRPKTLPGILAMPGHINLLTVTPVYCVLLCVASAAWGIFYWDLYCRKNYETVLIARPQKMK